MASETIPGPSESTQQMDTGPEPAERGDAEQSLDQIQQQLENFDPVYKFQQLQREIRELRKLIKRAGESEARVAQLATELEYAMGLFSRWIELKS